MLAIAYNWWTFIHLLGVVGFVATHGVSMVVLFQVRKERDRDKIRSLLQLSGSTIIGLYASLLVLLVGGFGGAFQQKYWSFAWIKWSLGLLIFEVVFMGGMARPYYKRIKEATALRPSGAPRISDEELSTKLASPAPIIIAAVGIAGLIAILYLMVFKPL